MEHPDLLKLQASIPHFFSYFKSDDILAISETKELLPFVFVINDSDYEHHLLMSLAVDYPHSDKAVEIALWCGKIRSTALTEAFYIAKIGTTYTGDDAYKYYDIETQLPLEEFEPHSDLLN